MAITLPEAIQQLRDDLRQAVIESRGHDILFTPTAVEVELSVSFATESKAGGGLALLTVLNVSGEQKLTQDNQHKIKLTLQVTDKDGKPIKVSANQLPNNLR